VVIVVRVVCDACKLLKNKGKFLKEITQLMIFSPKFVEWVNDFLTMVAQNC
jgi:hypothetical protein